MNYIEAPNEYLGDRRAVFLAGGISDTEDWQAQLIDHLRDADFSILNPRRKTFPMDDPNEGERQIEWEWRYLKRADLVAFWFPPQTLCPIALFELGACCSEASQIVVGCDPSYARIFDLNVQLQLRRPDVQLLHSLAEVADHVIRHPALTEERIG